MTVDVLVTADTTPPLSGTINEVTATIEVTVGGKTYTATSHGDGTVGDDYTGTFTVAVGSRRVVGLPDFARGPDQVIHVPAASSGLPISIDDGTDVRAINLVLAYDPTLMHIPFDPGASIYGASLAAGMPVGWTIITNLTEPGWATSLAGFSRNWARSAWST